MLIFMKKVGEGTTTAQWLSSLGATGEEFGETVFVKSGSEIFIGGESKSSGNDGALLAKYDGHGNNTMQRILGGGNPIWDGIALDASGNIYTCGTSIPGSNATAVVLIAKYNSSGVLQWQKTLGEGGDRGEGIVVDSSDNVYIVGSVNTGSDLNIMLAKYNSSGALQWERNLSGTGGSGRGIFLDSSGNVYISGYNKPTGINFDIVVAKYNSSGSIQWQRKLVDVSNQDYGHDIIATATGDVYLACTSINKALVVKYNSSGVLQWQRFLSGSGNDYFYGITIDSSENVYVSGSTTSEGLGSGGNVLLVKYNSSGSIQWQRIFSATGISFGNSVGVDNAGGVFVLGATDVVGAGTRDIILAKVPDDGSGTGAFGGYTYSASTLTDSVATLTESVGGFTDSAGTSTTANGTLSDSAGTLTSTIQ